MKKNFEEIKCDLIRAFYILLVFFPLISSLNSCCSKVGCLGADQMDGVYLKNFVASDVDSIIISSYKKGTDFKILTDSFIVAQCDSFGDDNFYMVFNFKPISMDNDYRIYFNKINKVFIISGLKTSKAECNDCFIKDHYLRLDEYEINLHSKRLGFIEIDKEID